MFKVNPIQRMRIKQIRSHWWFQKHFPKYFFLSHHNELNELSGLGISSGNGNLNHLGDSTTIKLIECFGLGNTNEITQAIKYGLRLLLPEKFNQLLQYKENLKAQSKLLRLRELGTLVL